MARRYPPVTRSDEVRCAAAAAAIRTRLEIRASNFQLLAKLPLRVLKQLLLTHIRQHIAKKKKDGSPARDGVEAHCELVALTVRATQEPPPNAFSVSITTAEDGESTERKVLLHFEREYLSPVKRKRRADATSSKEPRYVLELKICARCGVSTGCGCGWRATHCVSSYEEEEQSLLEMVDSMLVGLGLPCL